jgi:hypothetical protein
MQRSESRSGEGAPGYCGLACGPVGGTVPWTLRREEERDQRSEPQKRTDDRMTRSEVRNRSLRSRQDGRERGQRDYHESTKERKHERGREGAFFPDDPSDVPFAPKFYKAVGQKREGTR